ncbi:MAG: hypothetical protein ABIP54_01995 [Candidatus Andersenbacteria bacterium]
MTIDLRKGPSGSCEWLSRIISDERLTFEEAGILFIAGEKLLGSSFSLNCLMSLCPNNDIHNLIYSIKRLDGLGYVSIVIHRDEYTQQEINEYWEYEESLYFTETE